MAQQDLKAHYKKHYPKTISARLGYACFRCFTAVLCLFPLSFWCLLGSMLGWVAWYLSPSYRARLIRNIRIVTANQTLSRKEQLRLAHKTFQNNISNFLAAGKAATMSDKALHQHYSVEGAENITQALAEKKGSLCLIAHTGNWEILTRIRHDFPEIKRYASMYRELDNPLIEAYWRKKRSKSGCEMFGKKTSSFATSLESLREHGILGLLCDQHAGGQGTMISYFGKITPTVNLPALIQRRTHSAIIITTVETVGLAQWVIHMSTLPKPPHDPKDYTATTAYIAHALAQNISTHVTDGFWLHNRWKPTILVENNTPLSYIDFDYARPSLPLRIVICTPVDQSEADNSLPFINNLCHMRSDAEITIICPPSQQSFWQTQPHITEVATRPDNWKQYLRYLQETNQCDLDLVFLFDKTEASLEAALTLKPTLAVTFADHPSKSKGVWRRCERSMSSPSGAYTKDDYHVLEIELGLTPATHQNPSL